MEKIDKILKLADLGYSRVEIEKLLAGAREEATKGAENDEKNGDFINLLDEKPEKKDEKEDKTDEKKPLGEVDARVGTLEQSLKSIEKTLKDIQVHNVRWSQMDESAGKTTKDVAVDILSSVINPTKKGD